MLKTKQNIKYITVITLLFISHVINVQSQNRHTIDSLKNLLQSSEGVEKITLLNKISYLYLNRSIDTALNYAQNALKLSENNGVDTILAKSFSSIGIVHLANKDLVKALPFFQKALKIYSKYDLKSYEVRTLSNIGIIYSYRGDYAKGNEYFRKYVEVVLELGDSVSVALAYNNIGLNLQKLGQPDNALEYYQKALRINEENNNEKDIVLVLGNIADIYSNMNEFTRSVYYLRKAEKLARKIQDNYYLAYLLNNIGYAYEQMDSNDVALEYYNKSYEVYDLSGHDAGKAFVIGNMGSLHEKDEQWDKALKFYKKALEIFTKTEDQQSISSMLSGIGRVYLGKKDYAKSLTHLQKSFILRKETGDLLGMSESYKQLSEYYEATGAYRKAIDHFKEYRQLQDSVFNKKSNDRIAEMEVRYETEKKEKEIELLQKDRQLSDIEYAKQKSFRNYLIIIVIIILVLITIIYNRFRLKKKANKRLTAQNMEIKEQKEEITQQNEEIITQRDELDTVNKELKKRNKQITDSITYAQTIQNAIFPSEEQFKKAFPESFIFFKPKEIVSGDFFWLNQKDNKIYFAVADCTGHGVPGAFMSMIGNTLLNEIINEEPEYPPSEILLKLHKGISFALNQERSEEQAQDDGIDITLCCLNKKRSELVISCASQEAYIISNERSFTVAGDIYTIGSVIPDKKEIKFTDHKLRYEEGLCLYMYSDGYYDQFGGAKNNKYMIGRFKKLLFENHTLSMADQLRELDKEFEEWKGGAEQVDDVLVVGIKV